MDDFCWNFHEITKKIIDNFKISTIDKKTNYEHFMGVLKVDSPAK